MLFMKDWAAEEMNDGWLRSDGITLTIHHRWLGLDHINGDNIAIRRAAQNIVRSHIIELSAVLFFLPESQHTTHMICFKPPQSAGGAAAGGNFNKQLQAQTCLFLHKIFGPLSTD